MDDDEVLAAARADGFELEERGIGDHWCWGWIRDDNDDRSPAYLEWRQAISWMADRLRRSGVFR